MQHVTSVDLNHCVASRGVRLPHTPESGFSQFNHPIIMDDEIQAGVKGKAIDGRKRRNQGCHHRRFIYRT